MTSKTDMIEYIVQNSDNERKNLEALNYNVVKRIFNIVETGEDIEEDIFVIEEEPKKEIKTFTIEISDMTEEEAKEYINSIQERFNETVKIEEVEEVDYFTLSPAQRRAHQRSGIIPKKKVNIYTRFKDENPHFGI